VARKELFHEKPSAKSPLIVIDPYCGGRDATAARGSDALVEAKSI